MKYRKFYFIFYLVASVNSTGGGSLKRKIFINFKFKRFRRETNIWFYALTPPKIGLQLDNRTAQMKSQTNQNAHKIVILKLTFICMGLLFLRQLCTHKNVLCYFCYYLKQARWTHLKMRLIYLLCLCLCVLNIIKLVL